MIDAHGAMILISAPLGSTPWSQRLTRQLRSALRSEPGKSKGRPITTRALSSSDIRLPAIRAPDTPSSSPTIAIVGSRNAIGVSRLHMPDNNIVETGPPSRQRVCGRRWGSNPFGQPRQLCRIELMHMIRRAVAPRVIASSASSSMRWQDKPIRHPGLLATEKFATEPKKPKTIARSRS